MKFFIFYNQFLYLLQELYKFILYLKIVSVNLVSYKTSLNEKQNI